MDFGKKIVNLEKYLNSLSKSQSLSIKYRIFEFPKYDYNSPILFGHFPWYYRLVSRGSGLYVSKKESYFFAIAPNWNPMQNSFLESKYIIIRPEIYIDKIEEFITFVKSFYLISKTPIIIKQVSEPVSIILLANGFRNYRENENWDSDSKYDDQTFPEIVLKVNNEYTNKLDFARGFIKNKVSNNDFFIEEIDSFSLNQTHEIEKIKENIFEVFYKWLDNFQKRNPSAINKNFVSWNLLTFDAMISDKQLKILFVKDKHTEKPVGVFSLSKSSYSQYDVVFSFVSEFRGNFQRVAYGLLINWANKNSGCEFLNLGGSELESLFKFKKSIGEFVELNAKHLILDS